MLYRHRCHKKVHDNKVTEAPGHYEEMENFMRTEVLMMGIEKGKLQSINDTSDGINDTSC